MSNNATEVQVSLCNFCGNNPVMDGSILARQQFLEAGNELAVGLISNSKKVACSKRSIRQVRLFPIVSSISRTCLYNQKKSLKKNLCN